MDANWIDISVPLHDGMVHWPGDPPVRITRVQHIGRGGAEANVSSMTIGTHTGTHMDPPLHYVPSTASLDQMPLHVGIGPARVIEIADRVAITPDELARHTVQPGERILFKTHNSTWCWADDAFVEDYVYITPEAARALARAHVLLVGIDYLSVGGYHADGAATHRALLEAGVWILEGLNLSHVQPGPYDLVCLPLRIAASDGAPARAAIRPLRREQDAEERAGAVRAEPFGFTQGRPIEARRAL
ncbi:MAG TPA: cyclase family protein [Chloroflexota bacterium]|nr:cyclase family protein [Chloroflexota bacterium]